MTLANLKGKPVRDLARLAKQHGVSGWHSMRKEQLIRALIRKAKARQPVLAAVHQPTSVSTTVAAKQFRLSAARAAGIVCRDTATTQRIEEARELLAKAKSLATRPENGRSSIIRDRMVLMVRGPHWLHTFWEVTSRSMKRAQAALGTQWHSARPVVRLFSVESNLQASPSERVVRDIEVHGGVKNWFIDVRQQLRYRVELGYLATSGRFHPLARSNAVVTPAISHGDSLDAHWGDIAKDCEKIYSLSGGFSSENNSLELQELFSERLRRPMGPPPARRAALEEQDAGADRGGKSHLKVDAEMILYGVTEAGYYVTVRCEPIKTQLDGTFSVRIDMPNKRQVLPIVASTADGIERQTVVIAIERNTKIMEPLDRDPEEA